MPEPCLARNQAQNGYFVKRLIAFISNVYGGQILPIEVRGPSFDQAERPRHDDGANRAPKLRFARKNAL
jgi:hypothetical protein